MTEQQNLFVQHFLVDLNATHAAEKAGYSAPSVAGSRLLATVSVRQAIRTALDARTHDLKISTIDVVRKLRLIAFADANDLSQMQVTCCRHCHGRDFKYQWRSEEEWGEAVEKALEQHEAACKLVRLKRAPRPPEPKLFLPNCDGGFDFDARLAPIDECPHCDGRGISTPVFADTRTLSAGARALYAGVKKTKDGVEILKHDQVRALELLGRHMGMFNDKLIHIMPGGGGGMHATRDLEGLSEEQLEQLERINETIENTKQIEAPAS